MWTVYVRMNLDNGKRYVGVTSKGQAGRWERVLSEAAEIRNMREVSERDAYLGPRMRRQLTKLAGTLEYDVALGTQNWSHAEVLQTENLVEALLKERTLIHEYRCQRPNGYNRTAGGEIPPYTNIIDLVRWIEKISEAR